MSEPAESPVPVEPAVQGFWRGWTRRWTALDGLLLLCCPLLLMTTAAIAERRTLGDAVLVGVVLDDTPLTGVSRAALDTWFDERDRALRERVVRVQVAHQRFELRADEVQARWDRSVVERVLAAGRDGNWWRQCIWRLRRFVSVDAFHSQVVVEDAAWQELVARWERASLQVPREAGLRYAAARVQVIEPAPGQRVASDAAKAQLLAALLVSPDVAPQTLSLPLVNVEPATNELGARAAEARARALVSAPIRVLLELPAPVTGDAPTNEAPVATAPLLAEEQLLPRMLGPALRSGPSAGHPGELQLWLDPELLDRALLPIRERYEQKAQNATFDVDSKLKLTIRPSVIQTRISTAQAETALWEASQTSERQALLRVVPAEPPRITTEVAARLNIHEMVAQYSTQFPCCQPRVKNIRRIAELVDGAIVLPGETLSLNEFVGPRTEVAGFVPAPTIVLGEMDDTIGGGVSQFATTLFNAVYEGGYEVVERQPHTYYFDRYPIGNDATLSIPKPDLIFKNDTRSGLLIKTEVTNTSVRVRLFGDKEGRRVTRSVTAPFDPILPALELFADDTLEPTKERVEERGAPGFTVEVTRTIVLESGEINKQTRKVIYRPRVRRVSVHSCQLPEDHEHYTGKECPEPEVPDPEDTTLP
jgi:vancomycin resistance protein YoaR